MLVHTFSTFGIRIVLILPGRCFAEIPCEDVVFCGYGFFPSLRGFGGQASHLAVDISYLRRDWGHVVRRTFHKRPI